MAPYGVFANGDFVVALILADGAGFIREQVILF